VWSKKKKKKKKRENGQGTSFSPMGSALDMGGKAGPYIWDDKALEALTYGMTVQALTYGMTRYLMLTELSGHFRVVPQGRAHGVINTRSVPRLQGRKRHPQHTRTTSNPKGK